MHCRSPLPLLPLLQAQIERYERYSVPPEEEEDEKEAKAVDATLGALRLLSQRCACCLSAAPGNTHRPASGISFLPHSSPVTPSTPPLNPPPSRHPAPFTLPRHPGTLSRPPCSARLLQRPPAARLPAAVPGVEHPQLVERRQLHPGRRGAGGGGLHGGSMGQGGLQW